MAFSVLVRSVTYNFLVSLGPIWVLTFLFLDPKPTNTARAIECQSRHSQVPLVVPLFLLVVIYLFYRMTLASLCLRLRSLLLTLITHITALRDLHSALRLIGVDPTGYGEHSGRRGALLQLQLRARLSTNSWFRVVGAPSPCRAYIFILIQIRKNRGPFFQKCPLHSGL